VPATVAPDVAVLAPPAAVAALGAAVALLLARRLRAGAALVVVWAPGRPSPARGAAVVRPAARRLAGALDGRGLEASAGGRLVTVVVPDDPTQAAAAATRALAAAQGRPAVLALGGRAATFDALLASQDRVLLVPPPDADSALAGLALAGLADVGGRARTCTAQPTPLARAVVATGLAVPASLRRPLGAALDEPAP
jgi:hypothetical protein